MANPVAVVKLLTKADPCPVPSAGSNFLGVFSGVVVANTAALTAALAQTVPPYGLALVLSNYSLWVTTDNVTWNQIAGGSSNNSDIVEKTVTTTNPTTIVSTTPGSTGNYNVSVYYRIVNAACDVTIAVQWYNAAGVLQTTNVVEVLAADVTTGDYSTDPIMIVAGSAGAISVIVTAGTANNVIASASIAPV